MSIALIVLGASLAAGQASGPTPPTGAVVGRVVDGLTGEPRRFATILIGAVRVEPDTLGRFVIPGVPSGSRILAIHHTCVRSPNYVAFFL
jgi:hypothetical protein